jgi:hypothetical protein
MQSKMMWRVGAAALLGMSGTALAGPDWLEQGDAGSTIGSAQVPARPFGAPALTSIAGSLSEGFIDPDYVVLYLFNITINGEGYGLLANDDESAMSTLPKLTGASTDGTGVIITFPGDYVLAVTGYGRTPVSRTGAMFNFASNTEISGADGPGGLNPLSSWTGVGETGHYSFEMEATDFPVTPAPGVGFALMAGVGAVLGRRRRVR